MIKYLYLIILKCGRDKKKRMREGALSDAPSSLCASVFALLRLTVELGWKGAMGGWLSECHEGVVMVA